MKIKRALISVSDKTGLVDFAKGLTELGVELISSGGTAKALKTAGILVKDVSQVTGFPEIMDGRVKTLHPLIHGGILARRDNPSHIETAKEQNIPLIDLAAVNLYPFERISQNNKASLETAVENIDVGGPAMLRAAAKNYKHVAAVCSPDDYPEILEEIRQTKEVSETTRAELAVKVFARVAQYDLAISAYLSSRILNEERLSLNFVKGEELRYGENSHQRATCYRDAECGEASAVNAQVLSGKEMSYNNYVDADAALEAIKDLPADRPAAAVIKHANPCGLATGDTAAQALEKAWEGDPISAFGGVIAVNRPVDMDFAAFLKGENIEHLSYSVSNGQLKANPSPIGKFVEVIIAPDYTEEALEFLKRKSKIIRLLKFKPGSPIKPQTFRAVAGGVLVQERDLKLIEKFEIPTMKAFPDNLKKLAEFAMVACKRAKSNAIVLCGEHSSGNFQIMGVGAGQPNRVDSMRKLAVTKAEENLLIEFKNKKIKEDFKEWKLRKFQKMVLASDAFFPFDDTVREAARFGIKYIVQPGGSMRDEDSVKACDELGVAMAFTGLRHFNH